MQRLTAGISSYFDCAFSPESDQPGFLLSLRFPHARERPAGFSFFELLVAGERPARFSFLLLFFFCNFVARERPAGFSFLNHGRLVDLLADYSW